MKRGTCERGIAALYQALEMDLDFILALVKTSIVEPGRETASQWLSRLESLAEQEKKVVEDLKNLISRIP